MKLDIIGVSRRFGTSERTGNSYDISRLNVLGSLTPSQNENNTFQAAGFRQVEVDIDPKAVPEFLGLNYPCEVEVTTDSRPSQNGLITVVIGIKK